MKKIKFIDVIIILLIVLLVYLLLRFCTPAKAYNIETIEIDGSKYDMIIINNITPCRIQYPNDESKVILGSGSIKIFGYEEKVN